MSINEERASVIVQGDQYGIIIPIFRVYRGESENERTPVTPSDVDGVKIKIDKFEEAYPGNLSFDEELNSWIFPLKQEMSLKLYGTRKVQVQIKSGGTVQSSLAKCIDINNNIIKEVWDE